MMQFPLRWQVLLTATLAGCSAGRYEADYADRLGEFRDAAVFAALSAETTTVADGRVGLRIPVAFAPVDVDAALAKPPFLRKFPGYVGAYDARLKKADGGEVRPVLTLGVVRTADRRPADIEREIREQVKADIMLDAADWRRDARVEPTAGGPATWNTLSISGEQEFEAVAQGNLLPLRFPGTCEIWVSAEPKQEFCVVMAIRVPAEVAGQLGMSPAELVALVARTVEIMPADRQPAEQRQAD